MESRLIGRVWKYGDDVNTDVIFPGKYTYKKLDRKEMAQYALEDLDPEFVKKVRRMGSLDAEILFASPATVAALALTGAITGPRGV